MLRVGLTGGIGSGKSTVAALFARHGVSIIDTDEIARTLAASGKPAHREIVSAFGREVLGTTGEIDRARLRRIVFGDAAERRRLEAILHPRIRAEVTARTETSRTVYCLVIVPLLIEAGFTDLVDRVLVIDANESLRLERTKVRGGLNETETRNIMASQLSRQERLQKADDVITNDSDIAHLEREVTRLHGTYLTLASATGKT
ncbi:MAG TPA: dephospho-CoA kinase [Burkholderiales bacterium]|nr:dephospho-CoA kinase [Burkholderiales bacterium]